MDVLWILLHWDCLVQGIFCSWGTCWLLWSLPFLGDRCWHPGLSLPLVYLPLLVVVVCSELHWSVLSTVCLARLWSWVVAPACPWSERQCPLCTCHSPAWWSCRLCLALPCLLHLLSGLEGRLCGFACLFLPSSSLFGSLPYIVGCISLSVALIWPLRLTGWCYNTFIMGSACCRRSLLKTVKTETSTDL